MRSRWLGPRTFARRTLSSSSGQGFVEYILLIVIILSVALAVSAALFKPFDKWAKNYIGEYIYCLLDEGELPSLGGEGESSECSSNFENYSFSDGRPPKEGSGSSGSESEGSSSERGGRDRLRRGRNASSDSSSGGSSMGSRNRRSAMNLGAGFDNGNGTNRGQPVDVTNQYATNRNNSRMNSGRTSRYEITPRGSAYVGITGYIAQEQEKLKRREERVRAVGSVSETSQGFARGKARLQPTEIKPNKPKDVEFGDVEWSFGDMFRMILIIAIIIALVLFVGSQVMQISKSMEKGE